MNEGLRGDEQLLVPARRARRVHGEPPRDHGNVEMNAGGLRFEMLAPFERHRVSYDGKVCLLERPHEMADPSRAFRENPIVDCAPRGRAPRRDVRASGGEIVKEDGTPLPVDPEQQLREGALRSVHAGRGLVRGRRAALRVLAATERATRAGGRALAEHRLVPLDALLRVTRALDRGDGDGRRRAASAARATGSRTARRASNRRAADRHRVGRARLPAEPAASRRAPPASTTRSRAAWCR